MGLAGTSLCLCIFNLRALKAQLADNATDKRNRVL